MLVRDHSYQVSSDRLRTALHKDNDSPSKWVASKCAGIKFINV